MTLAKPRGGTRYCAGCGARLAHDNAGPLCSPCRQAHRNLHNEAPLLGSDFWATDQMRDALASKDMSVVVRAYRRHPAHGRSPLPQADVAYWLGISQGQLSRIEAGRNSVRDLDKLVNYARRLHIPSELLWFEVDDEPQRPRGNGLVRLPGGPPVSAATARTALAVSTSAWYAVGLCLSIRTRRLAGSAVVSLNGGLLRGRSRPPLAHRAGEGTGNYYQA